MHSINGYLLDIPNQRIFPGSVTYDQGRIVEIRTAKSAPERYILPGFVDAHVHVESSMLPPAEFARLAVVHGTVATVSDPHEIANVLGLEGVKYMLQNAARTNFKCYLGAPSCVPATTFETAGAELTHDEIELLFKDHKVKYLAEMMNWPGVLQQDENVMNKITLAQKYGLPVDGHAPGLIGQQAIDYINAGISTDHECFTADEAIHKLKNGMKVIIREGSAAHNFEELYGLIFSYPDQVMFCSDDKHPDSLVEGHINQLVRRSMSKGCDLFKVLKVACINPVKHYKLDVGLLQPGDPADFIVVDSLIDFKILQTFINGELVAENGKSKLPKIESRVVNNFATHPVKAGDFQVTSTGNSEYPVMVVRDQQLITEKAYYPLPEKDGFLQTDLVNDLLKIVVVNRYRPAKPAISFIKNFGLKEGAIASSVAHDSHNLVAVGTNDEKLMQVINLVIKHKGGVAAANNREEKIVPLPIAGLMSDGDGYTVAREYAQLELMAKKMGSTLSSPFMSLSFMALLVIPKLKLSDKGLFDGEKFKFVDQ